MSQEITSAGTSLNQVPTLIRIIEKDGMLKPGTLLLDYGAGRFHKTREFVEGTPGITYMPFDPYNRSEEVNNAALSEKYDVVMLSNVLNVIRKPADRRKVLHQIQKLMNPDARLYIRTYNAPRSGLYQEGYYRGQPTKQGTCWQNCQPMGYYLPEIREYFMIESIYSGHLVAKLHKVLS